MKSSFLAIVIIILLSFIQNNSESKVFDSESFYHSKQEKEHVFNSKINEVKEINIAGIFHYYVYTEKGILKISGEKYLLSGLDKKAYQEFKNFKNKKCNLKVRKYPIEGWKLIDVIDCK